MKFQGTTITGQGRGKKIGFPTVNVQLAGTEYEEGVFAVRGELLRKKFEGVAHFGPRPTFQDQNLSVEIHIFDFAEIVPEQSVIIFETIGPQIRGVVKFSGEMELVARIRIDIQVARARLAA